MSRLIQIIYLCGTTTVIILLAIFLSQSNLIIFPEAMLPMELYELASIWLAAGFLPMLVVTLLFRRLNRSRLIFVPAAICLGFLIFWAAIWIVGEL